MKRLAEELYAYLNDDRLDILPLYRILLSQWYLESDGGQSKLAKHFNNFSGLKYRKVMDDVCERKADYTDWEKETDAYLYPEDRKNFIECYFKFISRPMYDGWENHSDNEHNFIVHIAQGGFCGAISGIKLVDFDSFEDYRQAVCEEYVNRIERVLGSQELLEIAEYGVRAYHFDQKIPNWLNLSGNERL